jgi:ABC-2 type transport system ATP-binding protein
MSRSTPAIELDALTKVYGSKVAVDRLSLSIEAGTLICLLGPNGAGKTTTIHTIMGLKNPTSGDVRIRGTSVRSPEIHRIRRVIGYVPEQPVLYEHLTGREFLQFIAELYQVDAPGLARIDAHLEQLGLAGEADDLIRTYSLGMRKKLACLAALVHDPEILVLDEPTGALDAVSARIVKELMLEARDAGRAVLFTTHILEIAERLADRVAIIDAGTLRFEGSLEELREQVHGRPDETLEDLFIRVTGAPRAPRRNPEPV